MRWMALGLVLALAGCGDSRLRSDGAVPLPDAGPEHDAGPPIDAGPSDGGTMPTNPLVDPSCVDGMYRETLPTPSTSIDDLVAGYSSAQAVQFLDQLLMRRYPFGRVLVQGGSPQCVDSFLQNRGSAAGVIGDLATVVHECGHIYDNARSAGFDTNAYVIRQDLELDCHQGDTTDRGGLTFARSRIRNDEYSALRPPCGGTFRLGCDFYADIYLDGNPDDAVFDSGDQGFNLLFEETVQYVNSLASAYAVTGELAGGGSTSERDGILNWLWYVMRYLRLARTSFPSAYSHLATGDGGCWRRAILDVWGRAWLYLDTTEGMNHLGIEDDALMALVMNADLLSEIQRLRDAEGCAP